MPKLMTRKDFVKKFGIFLILTPLMTQMVSARTLFRGDSINLQELTGERIVATNEDKDLISLSTNTFPSLTELSYVKGVTSGIQSQLNTKISANQNITLSGDVTGSGTTAITTTIANDAINSAKIQDAQVTYSKIQNVTGTRLLGRHAGTAGSIQEITLGTGLSFSSGAINVEADQLEVGGEWGLIVGNIEDQEDLKIELDKGKQEVWTFGAQAQTNGFIDPGFQQYVIIPYNCTIKSWRIVGNNSGDLIVDFWKRAGIVPPDNSYSITGTQKPTLSSQQINTETDLNTWNNEVTAGDIIGWHIDSISGITNFVITIEVEK
jgi:hypothetical protein